MYYLRCEKKGIDHGTADLRLCFRTCMLLGLSCKCLYKFALFPFDIFKRFPSNSMSAMSASEDNTCY